MLPSKGFFNIITCPYYESGYCERHHCHYKHKKKGKNETIVKTPVNEEETNASFTQDREISQNVLPQPIPKISVEVNLNVKDGNKNVEEVPAVSTGTSLSSQVPSYKPTPIAELKKRHIPVFNAPSRANSVVIRKKTVPEGVKKAKTEYVPESLNGNAFPFSYNPTPTASVKTVERPEYSPEVNSDLQSVPNSYIPSKIGEEPTLPITGYVPEGSSETSVDYIPGSNKPKELPCYVPQGTSSLSLYGMNYSSDKAHSNSINEKDCTNIVNNKSLFDSLNFAEINDEINLLQEILEEDGRYDGDEEGLENNYGIQKESIQPHDSYNNFALNKTNKLTASDDKINNETNKLTVSDNKINNETNKLTASDDKISNKPNKLSASDDKINNKTKEDKFVKDSTIKIDKPIFKPESQVKNDTNKENNSIINLIDENTSASNKDLAHQNDEKHNLSPADNSLSKHNDKKDFTGKTNKDVTKLDRNKQDISKRSSKHKSDHKSRTHKSSSHSHDFSAKHSHSSKHYRKDKSDTNKHKKSSKRSSNDEQFSKSNSKKDHSKMKRSSTHSEKHENGSLVSKPNSRKKLKRKSSESSSALNDEVAYSDDGDVEIVQEPVPSIVITDSDSSNEDGLISVNKSPKTDEEGYTGKRRLAHISTQPRKMVKYTHRNDMNPYSDLMDRWHKVRGLNKPEQSTSMNGTQGKIRIAHVPNVAKLLSAKKEILTSGTVSTIQNGITFKNHKQQEKKSTVGLTNAQVASRPVVSLNKSKVQLPIRQECLNNLYDMYAKVFTSEIASAKALAAEQEISERVSCRKIYKNSVAMAILRLRKEVAELSGTSRSKGSSRVENPNYPSYTYGWSLYKCIHQYLLTDEEMIINGYPLKHRTLKNCAYIDPSGRRDKKTFTSSAPNQYECVNCKKQFTVNKMGYSIEENECEYHWGRLCTRRTKVGTITVYTCCSNDEETSSCTSGRYHVRETLNEDCLTGFVTTRPPPNNMNEEDCGVYALDCEMCFTTMGIALTRVTVVGTDNREVYDSLVLPEHPIIDYCTRFSGITEAKLKGCTTTLKDVQADLLKMFNSKTILIGHGLNNDLRVLKIIHNSVVDTSVLYPHRLGHPYKNALRNLSRNFLYKVIQNDESGHDSTEDAIACMELVLMRVKEDSKSRKPIEVVGWH